MTTPAEMDEAIKSSGLGWAPLGGIVIAGLADGDRCNMISCAAYASTANEIGLTAAEYVPALVLFVGDPLADPPVPEDDSEYVAHQATKKAFRNAIAAHELSWSCEGGIINVWHTSDRPGSEIRPQWMGSDVTTQTYYSQAVFAGATVEDMADALADLVAGDASAFELIMGAQ